jgi:hypothetical protein
LKFSFGQGLPIGILHLKIEWVVLKI